MSIVKIADDSGSGWRLKMMRRACCIWSHQWHNMIMCPKEPFFVTSWFFEAAVWNNNNNKKEIYLNANFCRKNHSCMDLKRVCVNMLDIALTLWLWMSNILNRKMSKWIFSAWRLFWKYQMTFSMIFQMVYLVSIS